MKIKWNRFDNRAILSTFVVFFLFWDMVFLCFTKFRPILIKWCAPSRWSFHPNFTWGSIEPMTIGKTHPLKPSNGTNMTRPKPSHQNATEISRPNYSPFGKTLEESVISESLVFFMRAFLLALWFQRSLVWPAHY